MNVPEMQTFTVERTVLLSPESRQRSETRRFVVNAWTGAQASRAADAMKYTIEKERGHHKKRYEKAQSQVGDRA